LHAVIDNYSRRILSWTLEERLGSGGTCRILREAVIQLNDCPEHTIVVADSGSENVKAHNELMPHAAFQAQTPDEVFFAIGDNVADQLADARKTAREKRMNENRAAACGACVLETRSGALLLQRPRSRM
jgi:hypothetical protein